MMILAMVTVVGGIKIYQVRIRKNKRKIIIHVILFMYDVRKEQKVT